MLIIRQLVARWVFVLVIAVNFPLFTNVIPWLHTCCPSAEMDRMRKYAGAAVSHGQFIHAPASRENAEFADTFGQRQICLACLLSAQLRSLSPPASIATLALTQTLEISLEPLTVPAVSQIWIQLVPRAPPASIPS